MTRKRFNKLLIDQVKPTVVFILREGISGHEFFEVIVGEVQLAGRNFPAFFAHKQQWKALCAAYHGAGRIDHAAVVNQKGASRVRIRFSTFRQIGPGQFFNGEKLHRENAEIHAALVATLAAI